MVNGDDYFSWNTEGSASKKKKSEGREFEAEGTAPAKALR